jgi:hypothetical protein
LASSVSEPSGRVWQISQPRLQRPLAPRRRSLRFQPSGFDLLNGADLGNSLTGLIVGIAVAGSGLSFRRHGRSHRDPLAD